MFTTSWSSKNGTEARFHKTKKRSVPNKLPLNCYAGLRWFYFSSPNHIKWVRCVMETSFCRNWDVANSRLTSLSWVLSVQSGACGRISTSTAALTYGNMIRFQLSCHGLWAVILMASGSRPARIIKICTILVFHLSMCFKCLSIRLLFFFLPLLPVITWHHKTTQLNFT